MTGRPKVIPDVEATQSSRRMSTVAYPGGDRRRGRIGLHLVVTAATGKACSVGLWDLLFLLAPPGAGRDHFVYLLDLNQDFIEI